MKNVKLGIWTPWAQIVCFECHGTKFPRKEYDTRSEEWEKVTTPQPLEENKAITYCDKCNCDIQVYESVAIEHNMGKRLQEQGIKAEMEQTGGMNDALSIHTIDGYYYLTYNLDGCNEYMLGRFKYNENDIEDEPEYLHEYDATFDTFEETYNYILTLDHLKKESN